MDVIETRGHRWLVAGYGPASWVDNTRAAGEVTLSRGGHAETYKVEETAAEDAIPVLRKYIAEIRVRPYFDAAPNASDEAVCRRTLEARRLSVDTSAVSDLKRR